MLDNAHPVCTGVCSDTKTVSCTRARERARSRRWWWHAGPLVRNCIRFSMSTLCFKPILLDLFTAFSKVNKLSRETPFGPRSPLNLSSLEFFATLLPVLLISCFSSACLWFNVFFRVIFASIASYPLALLYIYLL